MRLLHFKNRIKCLVVRHPMTSRGSQTFSKFGNPNHFPNAHDPAAPSPPPPWKPTSWGRRDPPRARSCSRVGTTSGGSPPPPRTSPGPLGPRRRLGRTRTRTREFRSSAGRRTSGRTRVLSRALEASRAWSCGRRRTHARRALLQSLRAQIVAAAEEAASSEPRHPRTTELSPPRNSSTKTIRYQFRVSRSCPHWRLTLPKHPHCIEILIFSINPGAFIK